MTNEHIRKSINLAAFRGSSFVFLFGIRNISTYTLSLFCILSWNVQCTSFYNITSPQWSIHTSGKSVIMLWICPERIMSLWQTHNLRSCDRMIEGLQDSEWHREKPRNRARESRQKELAPRRVESIQRPTQSFSLIWCAGAGPTSRLQMIYMPLCKCS